MIIGIEHVAIASPDPRKLVQWYVENLGFTVNYDSGSTVFVKASNGSMIEFISSEGALGAVTLKDPGLRHLALQTSDFDADYARLKAAGVKFAADPVYGTGVKVVFFSDPEGNFLHLVQRERPLP
ncbi:MAG: VOC family protein [Bryobacteraceae bacterium]